MRYRIVTNGQTVWETKIAGDADVKHFPTKLTGRPTDGVTELWIDGVCVDRVLSLAVVQRNADYFRDAHGLIDDRRLI